MKPFRSSHLNMRAILSLWGDKMYETCLYDHDDECLHNCPDCVNFRQKCFVCGCEFEEGEERYSQLFKGRGIQEICFECFFRLAKDKYTKDFAEEREDLYREYIRERFTD